MDQVKKFMVLCYNYAILHSKFVSKSQEIITLALLLEFILIRKTKLILCFISYFSLFFLTESKQMPAHDYNANV